MAQVLHLTGPVLVGPDDVAAAGVGGRRSHHVCRARPVTTTSRRCRAGCCRAWSTRTATSVWAPTARSTTRRPSSRRSPTATPARCSCATPGRRPTPGGCRRRDDLPRLVRAGRHIARTRRYIRNFAWEVEPDQLVEQVRLEARAGDGWVKLVGDWIDRDTGDLSPCWPADVLAEAVAAAHEEGARVTAHCFGEESLRDLAAAGTDCVEHACGLEPETIASFAAQGHRHRADPGQHRHLPADRRAGPREVPRLPPRTCSTCTSGATPRSRAARDAGIPVYVGTDAGGSLPHGLVATEVAHLAHAGFTTTEALARRLLGSPRVARPARARGGRGGRPGRLRRRPARGPRRPGRARRSSSCAAARSPDPTRRPAAEGVSHRVVGGASHIARHNRVLFDR